ncbi:ankyrin repeat-containing domain protein [Hyaloscypha sp. PMI_1271]|nr:ankyrin repeat-containing domain protein [Hyaloscypha sp. PMI_1271]
MNGLSALHSAVKRGNLTIIRIFVGSWAEFNIPVDEGDAILQSAHMSGNSSIVKLLTESGMVRIPDVSDGRNALHLSLAARSANASKLLIERGVNGWVKSLLHGRPLHVASAVGDGESVRMLLSNRLADTAIDVMSLINEPSDFFGTPLYAAAYGGHLGIVAQLLSSEANVDGIGLGNILGTPLLAACSQGHVDVVELLLAHGANKNAFNGKFKSAMDVAGAFRQPEVVRILE